MPRLLLSFLTALVFHALVVVLWAYKWSPQSTKVLNSSNKINLLSSHNALVKQVHPQRLSVTRAVPSLSQYSEKPYIGAIELGNNNTQSSMSSESDFIAASLTYTEPIYPKIAIKRGIEGIVKIRLRISLEGQVEATEILKSSEQESLDKAVLDSVPQWKFQKKESPYYVVKTVIFKLNN